MISGFSNERVSYRTRYLQFPSTMAERVPSISKPTVHVIKIRFNNIFKNEKVLFGVISVALSLCSLLVGYGLFSMYNGLSTEETLDIPQNTVAMEELNSISAEDAGITVMNKVGMTGTGASAGKSGSYFGFNNGGGIDPNTLLIASGNNENKETDKSKEVLTSKKAVVQIEDKLSVNPFLPESEAQVKKVKKVVANPNYVMPPTSVGDSSDANMLTKTSVSGIMYDKFSPSAIIKIDGTDYFVKTGDVLQGFRIAAIKPDMVVIYRGVNTYEARVGRILSTLGSNNTTGTANINNKFGGSGGIDTKNVTYKKHR